MPIYEYECACGHKFEEFKKFENRDAAVYCPECQDVAERKVSIAAFHKGAGFWESPSKNPQ